MPALSRWAPWPRRIKVPYFQRFYGALAPYGVKPVATLEPTDEWLTERPADVIHFHWPDSFWRQHLTGDGARLEPVRRLWRFLRKARARGIRVVWTVHNLAAHEGGDWIDALAYRVLVAQCDLIICHTSGAARQVRRKFWPRGRVIVMPMGNYVGLHPPPRPRDVVLAELGLSPTLPVVSCLGWIRAYKGLEDACAAAARLCGRVQLMIGGAVHRTYDIEGLRQAAAAVPGAILLERDLSDQEFADICAASDATLMPYKNITTSAVLLTSWSLGTGVVASELPFFSELIPQPSDAGLLIRPGDVEDLARGIEEYVAIPRERRTAAALREAARYDWALCVEPVARWVLKYPPARYKARRRGRA